MSTRHRRVIEQLVELHVAERGDLLHLLEDLQRVGPNVRPIGAGHDHLDGRRRAEAHHLADDVARLEAEGDPLRAGLGFLGRPPLLFQNAVQPRDDPLRQRLAEPLAQVGQPDAALFVAAAPGVARRRCRA